MKMDGNLSDCSLPVSDNGGINWSQCWENDCNSLKDINFGGDLLGHIEDKDLASKAVAFVVNSTRKGIVPLCADVATLFKNRQSLETKVALLSQENKILRSASNSLRTSHSASPTTPSVRSYTSTCQPEQSDQKGRHLGKRHLSTSSSDSLQKSPAESKPSQSNSSIQSSIVSADVHVSSDRGKKTCPPEISKQPKEGLLKISPKSHNSTQVQCDIVRQSEADFKIHEQFRETVHLNSMLSEELGAAKKEIEMLKSKLRELEMKNLARQYTESFKMENECDKVQNNENTKHVGDKKDMPVKSSSSQEVPYILPSPVQGCKCIECDKIHAEGSHGARLKNGLDKKIVVNSQLRIGLGEHVVSKGDRTGYIRYIGHLDKIGNPQMVFVGLELDAPVGSHNGKLNGKEYFTCPPEHGCFVVVQDIVCVIHKKASKPPVPRRNSSEKKKSSKTERNNNTITTEKKPQISSGADPTLV